jgi:hypothetical protein
VFVRPARSIFAGKVKLGGPHGQGGSWDMIAILEILAMPVFGLGLLFGMDRLERSVAAGRDLADPSAQDPRPDSVLPLRTIPLTRPASPTGSSLARELVRSASDRPVE